MAALYHFYTNYAIYVMRLAKSRKYGIRLLYHRFLNVRQVILVIHFLIEVLQSHQLSIRYIVVFLTTELRPGLRITS